VGSGNKVIDALIPAPAPQQGDLINELYPYHLVNIIDGPMIRCDFANFAV